MATITQRLRQVEGALNHWQERATYYRDKSLSPGLDADDTRKMLGDLRSAIQQLGYVPRAAALLEISASTSYRKLKTWSDSG